MNININEKIRNYIYYAVLAVVILTLGFKFTAATKQDKVNEDNYIRFTQAVNFINNQQYDKAQILLAQLDKNFQENYLVFYFLGICSAAQGNYSQAEHLMSKAQTARPALLQDQLFLCKYGQILYSLGDYKKAELYLQECMKYDHESASYKKASDLLGQVRTIK